MATIRYKIQFFTYWHTGSGLSAGTAANNTVIRNAQNLPYIPGKTVKGLLREAAEKINKLSTDLVSDAFVETVFGIGQDKIEEEALARPTPLTGSSFFSSAELSHALGDNLIKQNQQRWLFDTFSSTAIDENGLAKENTLRTLEITVPLPLFGTIDDFPEDNEALTQLDNCFKWIKRLGVNRNRGLGRCQWTRL